MTDTIFAVSSGGPPAAIAVMRVSGPAAFDAVRQLTGALPTSRRASLRTLRNQAGVSLDRALILTFPGPTTATGEDLAEFHLHGGRAVVLAVEQALAILPGLRPAVAGEFTRRALENGRLDLAQAQGLADLLAAETEGERKAAFAATEGEISRAVTGWLSRIAQASAQVEALLDYSDEDDVASADYGSVAAEIEAMTRDIAAVLDRPTVERLREGITVVLAGPPNAGKSSLFNALLSRDAAIVTPQAGTTRDTIEAVVQRAGIAFTLIDTAGLREETVDPIEQLGIARTDQAIRRADLVLWLGAPGEAPARSIRVHARSDVPGRETVPVGSVATSANVSASVAHLWTHLQQRATEIIPPPATALLHRQQRTHVEAAHAALRHAMVESDLLLVAEQLRIARVHLASLLGIDATEAMLDALFARFCVGK
ncbi:tRNA uridine-5-carboxymethylaminomethyl(34) synthesis GTPase MnmE [Sphingomonas sp. Mn802worker]|uniref:tRNA uridine-5-carboxymethylaminomethyl(34) synthesis GTPase MnmE n=1 Tax=Sphingomonas sp. Mn802worker TaxID=629773 RepID=UPI00036AFCBA|nr:tRNA uridine-5-carboxymethylaminomethyl(34) synthesis GTPase MnmE [Sphingomonas sp. Mn802worker]